jgi:hypothetical protein
VRKSQTLKALVSSCVFTVSHRHTNIGAEKSSRIRDKRTCSAL